ncbi:hypothetical protein L0222_06150 [bacterium]|nr:hypothetical protein [bacterium]
MIHKVKNKDIEGIWKIFDGQPSNWLVVKAMDFFVTLGIPAKKFALQKLYQGSGMEKCWAGIALGRMNVREAVKPLIALIRLEQNRWILGYYFRGLSYIEDQEAQEVIRNYAPNGSGNHQINAKEILEQQTLKAKKP